MSAIESPKRISPRATSAGAAALIVLWAMSWWLSTVSLGGWGLPVALAIAAAKGAIVVLVFMEIIVESTSVRVAFATGAALVVAMIALMVADVETRAPPPALPDVPDVPSAPGRPPALPGD